MSSKAFEGAKLPRGKRPGGRYIGLAEAIARRGAKWGARPHASRLAVFVACVLVFSGAACTGVMDNTTSNRERGGGAGGSGGNAAGRDVSCESVTPPPTAWRRLSAGQYRNTLRDLVTYAVKNDKAAASVLGEAKSLGQLPEDTRVILPEDLHGSFRRLDQSVEQLLVETTYDVAVAIGESLSSPQRLETVVGKCAVDSDPDNDVACLNSFIEAFGERALRRPLEAEEVEFYRGFHRAGAIDAVGVSDIIAALLTAPGFLYHLEHGDKELEGRSDVFTLTAFELASRLSYQFWDSMPDEELFAAAKSGDLETPEGYREQLDRVFASPRTRATIDNFYREWLKLEELKQLDANAADPVFRAFAGDDLPRPDLHLSMMEDVLSMLRYYTWEKPGAFEDLLSSELSFAKSADLAKIYGVPVWDRGEPPSFPKDLRPGLLTRALFLATGSANTRPIMKGVFTRTVFLCDVIPPPPDNAAATPVELSSELSTRQVVEAVTEKPGSSCAGCHRTLINSIGFATENFDSLGRVRLDQPLFSKAGKRVGAATIDTASVPQIEDSDETPSTGAVDLMKLISGSGKAQACFSRNYFRYSFSRWDDQETDGCAVSSVNEAARSHSLQDALKSIASVPEFQQRTIK